MRLPYLENASNQSKQRIINFLGLNYGCQTMDGEMSDTLNITTDDFPYISQRKPRVKESTYISPTTLFSKSGLFVIDGTRVLLDGENIGTVTEGRKQMASVGNIVVIFPDKKYYNVETETFGDIEITYTSMDIKFGTNEDGLSTITTPGNDFTFSVGDAVTITGCTVAPENNITAIIRGVNGKVLTFYANTFTNAIEKTSSVTIKRAVPDLDFICESNYRLWGCKNNTIYASKYADPFNFQVFDGLTSDSYYIQVGSDGDFTGCIPFSSHICFFKEDVLHKLYGSKPANYQVVTSNVFGVQSGCERSMCIINETLYYMGRNGVYSYTGGIPDLISSALGTNRYTDACAETDGEKYYISMKNGDEWGLFTYDVRRNIWLREDDTHAYDMENVEGKLCFIDSNGSLYRVNGDTSLSDEVIDWSVTFCPFTETINERKGYSKLGIRMDLGENSYLTVEISIDNGKWEKVYTTHNEKAKTISVPVFPNRCDNFQVRLSGRGSCKIKSFVRDFHVGSEV